MNLDFTAEEESFRTEVRHFLENRLPTPLSNKVRAGKRLSKEDYDQWHGLLSERGWLAGHWPVEYGGKAWTVAKRYLFELEAALAHAPRIIPFGLSMLGPVLIKYGTIAQKRHWLPRMLDRSDWWCQGFSEPGAGSDLAGLTMSAVRDGEHYIVNGQKTWTTYAHYANMIFCLVRTSSQSKRQAGISFLLIDMHSPGVEVRPIKLLNEEHEVNEVFFTQVRVPVENLVGQENEGWACAKYLLTHERTNIANIGESMAALALLKELAGARIMNGRPLAANPLFAAHVAKLEIDLDNMKTTNLRVLAAAGDGAAPAAESSMLKIRGTEIRQEIDSLMRRSLGPYAQPFIPHGGAHVAGGELAEPEAAGNVTVNYFNNRKLSIFGGSNEIQREIITKAILGL